MNLALEPLSYPIIPLVCLNVYEMETRFFSVLQVFEHVKSFRYILQSFSVFFLYQVFFHRHWRFTGQQGKEGGHPLFHSTTSTLSRTLRHLFATLHVRWLSRIFLIATLVFTRLLLEIYHLIELPFEWLIDDAMFVYLMNWY